ncbi:sigma-54-dependent Fis family transcriptional regulator [Calidifontibacillus oryziterrae]|uniref:sigma-54-dependent Fis family transcriptional regulator n=1 Tax=Calidifontibacillus oryziterrae TaxID=1191699 RepID=UPI0002DD722F|nr:sigma-54-dependent Fis family transcriptional regulator [Calidifontibacillus oryziterrae]
MIQLQDMMTPINRTIKRNSSLQEAIEIMKDNKWNIIPVTNSDGKLIGVLTRSKVYEMVLAQLPLQAKVEKYIIKEAVALPVNTPYEVIEEVVKRSRVGTGVVLDEKDRVIGLFTKTDMIATLLRSSNSLKGQLEIILENSHLGAIMTNGDQQIIYVNDRLSKMLETEYDELIGESLSTVIPSININNLEDDVHIKKLQIGAHQTILRLSSYQTVRNRKGFIALFQDISELEGMASELESVRNLKQTLDTAIDHAYDGMIMIDDKGVIKMVNPPLLELFSLKKLDLVGKQVDKLLPHLHLTNVLKSEQAEVSDFLEINGIKYIINRIPIFQAGKVIGAIGTIMFRQLNQVSELFKKLEKAEHKAAYYLKQLQNTETSRFTWEQIISNDPFIDKLKKSAAKAAKGRSTILIRGESGTGKELFAHAIHSSSARKDGRFVVVNCAAIPEDLLESEFFGYEGGAFTGAKQKGKPGKFDLADGGTLFLDEIGDMSLSLQAKLLRVLQEREFYRVGGTERIQVDVRIIAATNRPLEEMVENGEFREDLYYRLNVISFHIPPLRKRPHDIGLLIATFIKDLNRLLGTSVTGIHQDAQDILLRYHWPGNVRELRNILERAMTFAEFGKIQASDLPEYVIEKVDKTAIQTITHFKLAESAELDAIKRALHDCGGNKSKAAKILGISRSGLYEKLKKYKL